VTKQKILVVDDEPEAVELVEFNLKQAGFEVATAADGEEAFKKAKANLPALMVLDCWDSNWARMITSPSHSAHGNWSCA
jgi:DNA-binding response OmpR family regulator